MARVPVFRRGRGLFCIRRCVLSRYECAQERDSSSCRTNSARTCRARAEEAFSKLNGSADPAHDFAVLAATYSDETDRDQHPSGYTFTVGDGTLPAACEEAAQALEEGQFSGVVEADDGFYLILRKPVDLEAVAPDYFDALLQAAADSADISTTRTYADLDVSRFYDELIAARAELDASGGEVA